MKNTQGMTLFIEKIQPGEYHLYTDRDTLLQLFGSTDWGIPSKVFKNLFYRVYPDLTSVLSAKQDFPFNLD